MTGLVISSSNVAVADQSVLKRQETSAVSVATTPARVAPAASEKVSSTFHAAGSSVATSEAPEGTIKLKWRARHPNSFRLNAVKQDSAVKQASQLTELNGANPFDDPFGDRTRSRFTSATNSQDAQPFREVEPLPDDNRFRPSEPLDRSGDSLLGPSRDGCTNCPDKCYRGRDCCDELRRCETAQELIRQYGIRRISLDITPSIRPDAVDPAELEEYKNQQLFQASSRTWHDSDGNQLATGTLVDYSNDRIYVATESGETKKFFFGKLSDDDRCFVSAWWNIPAACKLGNEKYAGRNFAPMTMTWTASQVCHKPLYFEEIALERYGHTAGPLVQPWISGAHFFTNIAILPYRMGINPLGECQYDLGYYRPGNCAPWMISPIPLSARGALFQAGAVTGVSYLIP